VFCSAATVHSKKDVEQILGRVLRMPYAKRRKDADLNRAYAPRWMYAGYPHQFQKHYYAAVGELKNTGEEYECAKALDMTGKVKHWVRNLERRGFWLPLAKTKFYPDFAAELTDGRRLVVEHKGEVYATNDDSKEKCNIGDLWEKKSDGKTLFLMTVVEKGKPGLFEQIAAKIG